MLDEIHASHLIHVPTHKQKTLRKEQKEGRYLCKHCQARTHDPNDLTNVLSCTEAEHEFEAPLHNESAVLGPAISTEDLVLVEESTVEGLSIDASMEDTLRDTLAGMGLKQRDMYILLGYFNVAQAERKSSPKTLPQLACMTNITPELVRQVKEHLLKSVKKELKKRSVRTLEEICS